jgi:hypothetical protein
VRTSAERKKRSVTYRVISVVFILIGLASGFLALLHHHTDDSPALILSRMGFAALWLGLAATWVALSRVWAELAEDRAAE